MISASSQPIATLLSKVSTPTLFFPLVTTGIVAALSIYGYYKWISSKNLMNEEDFFYVDLLYTEEVELEYVPSISTVNFYGGDITTAEPAGLSSRVVELVRINPWLTGQLVNHKNAVMKLRYLKDADKILEIAVSRCYQEVIVKNNDVNNPFNSFQTENTGSSLDFIAETTKKYLVDIGNKCLNKPEVSLFRVTVIKIVDNTTGKVIKSILLVSLSHLLGDGFTFYSLFAMLDTKVPIRPLIVD